MKKHSVCVYCSSSGTLAEKFYEDLKAYFYNEAMEQYE